MILYKKSMESKKILAKVKLIVRNWMLSDHGLNGQHFD